ncbi:MAG TPA: hypothetical protein ENK49_03555 [Gammaproteobacteria bacterium]|nr:hypothetical protein [Gammaproteobacteria bacterium]
MDEQRRATIRRRASVLDEEQSAGAEGNTARRSRPVRPLRRLVPLLAFLVIGFLIARQEIPAVRDAWDRLVTPQSWQARQTCQQAAIADAEHREFSRVLKPGRVNRTVDGIYIDRLLIGTMGESGTETRIEYTCYLDADGKLVKLHRSSP